ncbi:MAG: ATP-binding protein [Acidiferrobacteraceae bacterium]
MIALIIAANQMALYLFVRHTIAEERAQKAGSLFAQQILLVRRMRNGTGPVVAGGHANGFSLVTGDVSGALPPKLGSLLALAQKSMRARLGPRAALRLDASRRRLWLVWHGQRPFSLSLPLHPWRSLHRLFLYWKFATVALLAFLGALIALGLINRPLSRLVTAMDKRSPDGLPMAVSPSGPREIRSLAEHYNRMLADLRTVLDERELVLVGISHDLRTPLTRLRLACAFLPDSVRETQAELVSDIRALDAILDQFIAFARHGQEEARIQCQLNDIVQDVARRFSAPALASRVVTDCALLPPILLQPLGIRRLLDNLVDNARRYAPGEITIRTRTIDGGIDLIVEDRGPGIPKSLQPRLGRPFSGVSDGVSGMGLGIAIVWAVARAHGGVVLFEDRAGGGLRVRVRLPVHDAQRAGGPSSSPGRS